MDVLKEAGIEISDLSYVGFYDKPFLKFERLLLTYLTYAPLGIKSFLKAMPLWLKEKLYLKDYLHKELDYDGTIILWDFKTGREINRIKNYDGVIRSLDFLTGGDSLVIGLKNKFTGFDENGKEKYDNGLVISGI